MPFPLSIEGRFEVARSGGSDARERVLDRAKHALREVYRSVAVQNDQVATGRFFLPKGGTPLTFVDHVVITVTDQGDSIGVSYRLGTTLACYFWAALILVGVVFVFVGSLGHPPPMNPVWAVAELIIGWGWMFGVVYVLAWLRVPGWVKGKLAQPLPSTGEAPGRRMEGVC